MGAAAIFAEQANAPLLQILCCSVSGVDNVLHCKVGQRASLQFPVHFQHTDDISVSARHFAVWVVSIFHLVDLLDFPPGLVDHLSARIQAVRGLELEKL